MALPGGAFSTEKSMTLDTAGLKSDPRCSVAFRMVWSHWHMTVYALF